ncbi:AcrR family transcriptional regulator [Bradyrhizobium sp. USDA 4369]
MKSRTPALARICDAAVQHFAVTGYDAASLNEIAAMVGIRKASLYSHVTGKDELFLQVLEDAAQIERDFVAATLAAPPPAGEPGGAYIEALAARYDASVHLRFLLRTAFLPPVALKPVIGQIYIGFLDGLQACFFAQLPDVLSSPDRSRFGHAYLGIVESLFVAMIYADQAETAIRREAMWHVFRDSLALRMSSASDTSLRPEPSLSE